MTGNIDRHSVIDLTTVGRVSGRPHTIEIWFAHRNSTIYLLSGGGARADWVRNLTHTPEVQVRVAGRDYTGAGRIVTDPQEGRIARDAVHDKYVVHYRGDLSSWREVALPIAIDLEEAT